MTTGQLIVPSRFQEMVAAVSMFSMGHLGQVTAGDFINRMERETIRICLSAAY